MSAAHRFGPKCLRALATATLATTLVVSGAATASADPDVGDIESKIEKQAADLEGVVEDFNAANEDLKKTKDQIEDLEEKLAPFEKELDKLYDKSEPIVESAYMTHGMGKMSAVLEAGSPENYSDRMSALDGLTAGDSDQISTVADKARKYQDKKDVLDDLKGEQKALRTELKDQKKDIEKDIDRLQDDRQQAFRDDAAARGESIDYVPEYVPGDRGVVVRHAMKQLGDDYVWASAGPDSYDCSGLILDSYKQIGIDLPHNARQQYAKATHISRGELQPGDSVYYNGLQHVGMYIGEDYVIHAPTFGDVVKIDKLDDAATPYYGAGTFL